MIKLVIWDLDDVIWKGTLAEEGSLYINTDVIDFIKRSESQGIIHSVCSKNEFEQARKQLIDLDIFNLFVFPSIEYTAKGPRIKEIIENCQLRPCDVLFVDDNILNTNEAKYYLPDLNIENSIDFIKTFPYHVGQSRTEKYRILERKILDKDNTNFLIDSDIHITITNDNDCILFHDRIVDLVNRSNVLNFTKSRMNVDFTDSNITPYFHFNTPRQNYAVFAWDKYGYYGLVGYFSSWDGKEVEHFVFSCRILNMGIENFCSQFIEKKLGWKQNYVIDTSKDYSYIKLRKYADVKNYIESKENIIHANNPVASINFGYCLSYIVWALTGISHRLTYQHDLLESIDEEIVRSYPKLNVFSVFSAMDIDSFSVQSITHMRFCVHNFYNLAKNHDKKILLVIPKLEKFSDPLLECLYREFESLIDDEVFSAYYFLPTQPDFRHHNRKSLYEMSQYIKSWVEKNLQDLDNLVQ